MGIVISKDVAINRLFDLFLQTHETALLIEQSMPAESEELRQMSHRIRKMSEALHLPILSDYAAS